MTPALRERNATAARAAILDVLIAHLEAGDADIVSMETLADEAGVSRRTLYRYFPSRDSLFAAANERIYPQLLGVPVEIESADDITAAFVEASQRLERRPALARSLVETSTGRGVRAGARRQRAVSIRTAVAATAPRLPEPDIRQAAAAIAYLCSASAWLTMGDESGLSGDEARAAVTWAVNTLLADLRARNQKES